MNSRSSATMTTPIGLLQICSTAQGICQIEFIEPDDSEDFALTSALTMAPLMRQAVLAPCTPALTEQIRTDFVYSSDEHLQQAVLQLDEYFAGQRQQFNLQLAPQGTAFQRRTWQALCAIPFGHRCSYGDLAAYLQQPSASRAVGAANGRNPLAIVVPCHRVIGASGKLTGYAGGVSRKLWLLQHEAQQGKRT